MPSVLISIGKLAIFLLGAYLSGKQVASHWYVGPIFGVVVIIWQATSLRALVSLRSGAFVAASTLIYALVVRLHEAMFQPFSTQPDYSFLVVAVGTILLPIAHALCLQASWKRVIVAIPGIYGLTFALGFLANALGVDNGPLADVVFNGVTIWQGVYLLFLFGRRPAFLKRR